MDGRGSVAAGAAGELPLSYVLSTSARAFVRAHQLDERKDRMADYTIKNLREAEDMAPKFGLAPDMEARFPASELGLEATGLSLQRLAPNATQPFGHSHKKQEEVYLVLRGKRPGEARRRDRRAAQVGRNPHLAAGHARRVGRPRWNGVPRLRRLRGQLRAPTTRRPSPAGGTVPARVSEKF